MEDINRWLEWFWGQFLDEISQRNVEELEGEVSVVVIVKV